MTSITRPRPDSWHYAQFICAVAVMAALEGVSAYYIHSLFATENYLERIENTGNFRSINRDI